MKYLNYISYPLLYTLRFFYRKFPNWAMVGFYTLVILFSIVVPVWVVVSMLVYFVTCFLLYVYSESNRNFVNEFLGL